MGTKRWNQSTSERTYPADRLIKLPDNLSAEQAASVFFKGLTAQYLIKSTYPVTTGSTVLLYGAAGGVGQLLASWAQHLGATVIGVVSKVESIERAKRAGCAEVLIWGEGDLAESVSRITGGRMVDVVYDGIGRQTFDASLASLRTRGMMVSIGASSGAPDPVSLATLNAKSLFLTRPGLGAHISDITEYKERAHDVLEAIAQKIIAPQVAATFPLAEASKAHTAIESGKSTGSVILVP